MNKKELSFLITVLAIAAPLYFVVAFMTGILKPSSKTPEPTPTSRPTATEVYAQRTRVWGGPPEWSPLPLFPTQTPPATPTPPTTQEQPGQLVPVQPGCDTIFNAEGFVLQVMAYIDHHHYREEEGWYSAVVYYWQVPGAPSSTGYTFQCTSESCPQADLGQYARIWIDPEDGHTIWLWLSPNWNWDSNPIITCTQ